MHKNLLLQRRALSNGSNHYCFNLDTKVYNPGHGNFCFKSTVMDVSCSSMQLIHELVLFVSICFQKEIQGKIEAGSGLCVGF